MVKSLSIRPTRPFHPSKHPSSIHPSSLPHTGRGSTNITNLNPPNVSPYLETSGVTSGSHTIYSKQSTDVEDFDDDISSSSSLSSIDSSSSIGQLYEKNHNNKGSIVKKNDIQNQYEIDCISENTLLSLEAREDTTFLQTFYYDQLCRPFRVSVTLKHSNSVKCELIVTKPYSLFTNKVFVRRGDELLGDVTKKMMGKVFYVKDANGKQIYEIREKVKNVSFSIIKDKKTVGSIEARLGHDILVQFPVDANSNEKCLLLGTAFLLEYNYFNTSADIEHVNSRYRKNGPTNDFRL
ncbi:hypothetical protein ABK040_002612 [Willaertia magna]